MDTFFEVIKSYTFQKNVKLSGFGNFVVKRKNLDVVGTRRRVRRIEISQRRVDALG